MSNPARIVLAEDDREQVYKHASFLMEVCGYEVAIVHRGSEILRALDRTQAGWLILDLELEDGFVDGLIPMIRETFHQDLYILILTGYYDLFTDTLLFQKGVNEVVHKPYRPEDVLIRMRRLEQQDSVHGKRIPTKVLALRTPSIWINLRNGQYVRGTEQGTLPDALLRFLQLMARRENGGWKPIERADLMILLWGKEVSEQPKPYGDRLRSLIYRVRSEVGEGIVRMKRIQNNSAAYELSQDVEMEEEGQA